MNIATHHIKANRNEIAKIVFMMGDPLRAKKIAKKYLNEKKLICNIRGINIWTGKYNGNIVTIMGHGMGLSSISIYAHELYEFFNVDTIIRLGTSASYVENINQGDIIVGNKYYTYSLIGEGYGVNPYEPIDATKRLVNKFIETLKNDNNVNFKVGGIYSSEWFYAPAFFGEGIKKNTKIEEALKNGNIIGKEMEGYALQLIANYFNKEALTIVTVIDNLKTKKFSSSTDKIKTTKMCEIAFKAIFDKK